MQKSIAFHFGIVRVWAVTYDGTHYVATSGAETERHDTAIRCALAMEMDDDWTVTRLLQVKSSYHPDNVMRPNGTIVRYA